MGLEKHTENKVERLLSAILVKVKFHHSQMKESITSKKCISCLAFKVEQMDFSSIPKTRKFLISHRDVQYFGRGETGSNYMQSQEIRLYIQGCGGQLWSSRKYLGMCTDLGLF